MKPKSDTMNSFSNRLLATLSAIILLGAGSVALAEGVTVDNRSVINEEFPPYSDIRFTLVTGGGGQPADRSAVLGGGKISADLMAIAESLMTQRSRGGREHLLEERGTGSTRTNFRLKGDGLEQIEVYLSMHSLEEDVLTELKDAGVEIELVSRNRSIVQGFVPLDRLDAVARLDTVRSITRPSYAIATAGSILSEGDTQQGTTVVRTLENARGNGVRIGVLSIGLFTPQFNPSGFPSFPIPVDANADSRVQSQDLPSNSIEPPPTTRFLGGVTVEPASLSEHLIPTSEPFPEGAAMLEVVHDVAPDAQLFYGDGRTDLRVEAARRFFLNNNVDIIVDNLVFPDAGRFDGSSSISRITEAIASGREFNDGISFRPARAPIAYFVSAGGITPSDSGGVVSDFPAYVVDYYNPPSELNRPNAHNFAPANFNRRDEVLEVSADLNTGLVEAVLIWDDVWDDANPRASVDLDLFFINPTTGNLDAPLASSIDLQIGQGLPVERLVFDPRAGGFALNSIGIVIRKKNPDDRSPLLFTLLILQGTVRETQLLTHGVPLNNADAPAPVITVGHTRFFSSGLTIPSDVMPGRSLGSGHGDRTSFLSWYEGQEVPTVMGFDSVSTQSTSNLSFTGPSAAVAHVGAFGAIIRQRFPLLSTRRYAEVFSDTSEFYPDGTAKLRNAIPIQPASLNGLGNAPEYPRTEPINIYLNFLSNPEGIAGQTQAALAIGPGANYDNWTRGTSDRHQSPEFGVTAQGLTLTASGREDVYGYWETPVLDFINDQGVETTVLRADRIYEIEVRVGSNESDPTRVPDFRLRATSGTGEEASMLVVSGLTDNAAQAPTTIGGKTYRFYYRPTNPRIGEQGMRVAFEMLKFDPRDNADATLYLQSLTVRELQAADFRN